MQIILILNKILELRIVQYALLALVVLLTGITIYKSLNLIWVRADLKTTKASLVWSQSALDAQNAAVKAAGEEYKKLEAQNKIKSAEAERAKAVAAKSADSIMQLLMSKDCEEVAQWGVAQGLRQSRW